MFDEKSTYLDL